MVLGIDLGTSNTLAATLTRDGQAVLIPDAGSKETSTPSLLLIEGKMALAGCLAEQYMDLYPDKNFIRYYKRCFGTQQPVFLDTKGNNWFSETLAAMMLKKIRFDAEMALPEGVDSVVITVPAHYNDAQRRSVLEAAKLAEMKLAALVEEPVAAALSYISSNEKTDEIIMVYDFGGGTFDLTLITCTGNQVYVLAKDGISNLGGKEFDDVIAGRIRTEYKRCFAEELPAGTGTNNKLRRLAENVKLGLCASGDGWYSRWLSFSRNAFEFTISLKEFEMKSAELIQQTQHVVDRCLRSVGMSLSDINKVVMVGGTSNIPFLKEYWKRKLDAAKQQLIFYDPLSSIALGAAVYAGSLTQKSGVQMPLELKSVSTYNIAVRSLLSGLKDNDILIYKNSPLPIQAKRVYSLAPGGKIALLLVQYWDEAEVFELGTITVGPYANSEHLNISLMVENRSNGTIGLKVKAENGKDLKFDFAKEPSKYQYDAVNQKSLLDSVVINNIY